MLARFLAVAAFGALFPLNCAFAENSWGPDCNSLEDCVEYLHAPPCVADDFACKNYEQASPLQLGLQPEFEKFGKAAVPPLIEILKSGSQLEVARAAEALWTSDFITPGDYPTIHAAWWRVPGGSIGILASRYPTPEFVRKVVAELRRNPLKEGDVANTFSNFREYPNEKPNGVIAAVTEHVECSSGEPCDTAFAKRQYAWIDSNVLEIGTVGPRLAEAIRNPALDGPARLAALEYFLPSEYLRTKKMMKDFAIPIMREQLKSSLPEIRLEAARILTTYGDTGSIDVLFELAEDADFDKRVSALASLASIGIELESYTPRIKYS